MNNALIQHVLAGASADTGPVAQLLRELLAPGGAVEIADQAAWQTIRCECPPYFEGETAAEVEAHYFHIRSTQLQLDLAEDGEAIAAAVERAVNYLSRRNLLVSHPGNPDLVKLSDEANTEGWLW